MASASRSLSLFIARITSTILIVCVVFVASANIVNPHRFHNRLFRPQRPPSQLERHRARRDDCREDDWEALTFAGRIALGDSDAIMQGTVDRLIDWNNPTRPYQGRGVYVAEVTLDCIYKGWGYPDRVNISGFGEASDCVDTHVATGKSYIFLIKKDWNKQLVVSEFNHQSGVTEATRYTDSTAKSLHRCRSPSEESVSIHSEDPENSYSFNFFSSPDDADIFELYSAFGSVGQSAWDKCPAYDFFSFLSVFALYGGDYYDYDKDGYLDYCSFLNTASSIGATSRLLLLLPTILLIFIWFV